MYPLEGLNRGSPVIDWKQKRLEGCVAGCVNRVVIVNLIKKASKQSKLTFKHCLKHMIFTSFLKLADIDMKQNYLIGLRLVQLKIKLHNTNSGTRPIQFCTIFNGSLV